MFVWPHFSHSVHYLTVNISSGMPLTSWYPLCQQQMTRNRVIYALLPDHTTQRHFTKKYCLSWHHSHCTKFGNMRSLAPPPKHDLKITGGYITMRHELSRVQPNTGYCCCCCLCKARGFYPLVMTIDAVFFCLGVAPRVQLLKKSAWYLHLIGDKAPPAARDSSEVARALNRRWYPHVWNCGLWWCLNKKLSLKVQFSMAHNHADVIHLLP